MGNPEQKNYKENKTIKLIKKIISSIIVLIIIIAGILIFLYITDRDEVVLPLKQGTIFEYQGEYISKGSQKTIKIKAPIHKLIIDREFKKNGKKHFYITFIAADTQLASFIVVQENDGLYVASMNKNILLIPKKLKRGRKWEFLYASSRVEAKVGKSSWLKIFKGKVRAREIFYQSQERSRVRIWVNNELGIVSIRYSYIQSGSARSEANLYLSGMKNK